MDWSQEQKRQKNLAHQNWPGTKKEEGKHRINMIDNQIYEELLSNGLILDHYVLLCQIRDNVKPLKNRRVQGFINLLNKRGYLKDEELTDKALEILQGPDIISRDQVIKASEKESVKQWAAEMHTRCQEKLMKLTGAKQVKDRIQGKAYAFLPNSVDLGNALFRMMKLYKVTDREKVEATIMTYMETCAKSRQWFPVLQYYIIKNNASQLVTDMESAGETESGPKEDNFKSTQRFV